MYDKGLKWIFRTYKSIHQSFLQTNRIGFCNKKYSLELLGLIEPSEYSKMITCMNLIYLVLSAMQKIVLNISLVAQLMELTQVVLAIMTFFLMSKSKAR